MRFSPVRMGLALAALIVAIPAAAQELPPLPPSLLGASISGCLKLDDEGKVTHAFLRASTGDAATDRDALGWLRQLRWARREPGEAPRGQWFPLDMQFGGQPAPPGGDRRSCLPAA